MAIVQVALDIPDHLIAGLQDGTYVQMGGVIRHADTKQLVKLLEEVPLPDEDTAEKSKALAEAASHFVDGAKDIAKESGKAVAKAVQNIPKDKTVIGIGIGIAVASVTAGVLIAKKIKDGKTKQEPTTLSQSLGQLIQEYLEAIKAGNLDEEKLDQLINCIDEIRSAEDSGQLKIELNLEQMASILELMRNYTIKLHEANSMTIDAVSEEAHSDENANLETLRRFLVMQKQIFEKAA